MKKIVLLLFCPAFLGQAALAQNITTSASDSVYEHIGGRRLTLGGYGEAAYSRNFYSDNVYRYSSPESYKNEPSHGRFDIPHAVFYISYDFGKGWTLSSEIEFEHTGTGSSTEKEFDEGGEWELENEKGGEVELEQFWIQKTFASWLSIRAGHIVVLVGLTNAHHEPLNYFTVYRPEGEYTILPCTWHDTGISLWGRAKDWRYELQLLAGLDGFMFDREGWIHNGAGSPYELKVANKYGIAARFDNYSVKGLRIGMSGYFGRAMHNSYPHDLEGDGKKYDNVKGNVAIGSIDFTYDDHDWIIRGNADYGYLSDASTISYIKRNLAANNSPYKKNPVGKNAVAVGAEGGYDIFSLFNSKRLDGQKFFVFARYEYYNSYIPAKDQQRYPYTGKIRVAGGINYHPIRQIAIKAEFSERFFHKTYNNEPSINIGIAYEGFFK